MIRRLACLYEKPVASMIAQQLDSLRQEGQDEHAEALKARYTRRMYNLSEFVKTLKQRFTMSYNRRHGRKGTLWESRFKSLTSQLIHLVAVDIITQAGFGSQPSPLTPIA